MAGLTGLENTGPDCKSLPHSDQNVYLVAAAKDANSWPPAEVVSFQVNFICKLFYSKGFQHLRSQPHRYLGKKLTC